MLQRHFYPAGFAVYITLNMTKIRAISSRLSRLVVAGAWIAGVAGLSGIVAMVLVAIEKVSTGRGLETYRTYWMVEFNWVGFLIFLAVAVAAMTIGAFFRLKEWREIRKLQAKYSEEHHG